MDTYHEDEFFRVLCEKIKRQCITRFGRNDIRFERARDFEFMTDDIAIRLSTTLLQVEDVSLCTVERGPETISYPAGMWDYFFTKHWKLAIFFRYKVKTRTVELTTIHKHYRVCPHLPSDSMQTHMMWLADLAFKNRKGEE